MAGKGAEILEYGFLESVDDAGSTFTLDRKDSMTVHYNKKVTNGKKGDKFAIKHNRSVVTSVYGSNDIEKCMGTVDYVQQHCGYVSIDSSNDRAVFFACNLKHPENRPNVDLRKIVKTDARVELEVVRQFGYKEKYRAVLVELSSEANATRQNCSPKPKNDVSSHIHHFLLSSKDPLSLDQLQTDFEDWFGYQISYENWGFNSLLEYLRSIPELFEITQINEECCVRPVCNEKVRHIRKMVEAQKGAAKPKASSQQKPKKEVAKAASMRDQAVVTYKGLNFAYGWSKLRGRVFIPISECIHDWNRLNPGRWFNFTPEPQMKNEIAWIARKARVTDDKRVDFEHSQNLVLKNLLGFITCIRDDFALVWTEELGRVIVYKNKVKVESIWDDLSVLDNVKIDVHEDRQVIMETCWQTHNIQNAQCTNSPPDWSNVKVVMGTLKKVSNNWKAEFTVEGCDDVIVSTHYDYYKERNAQDFEMELESHSKFSIYIVPTIDATVWQGIYIKPMVEKKTTKKLSSEKKCSSAQANEGESAAFGVSAKEPIAKATIDILSCNEKEQSKLQVHVGGQIQQSPSDNPSLADFVSLIQSIMDRLKTGEFTPSAATLSITWLQETRSILF